MSGRESMESEVGGEGRGGGRGGAGCRVRDFSLGVGQRSAIWGHAAFHDTWWPATLPLPLQLSSPPHRTRQAGGRPGHSATTTTLQLTLHHRGLKDCDFPATGPGQVCKSETSVPPYNVFLLCCHSHRLLSWRC